MVLYEIVIMGKYSQNNARSLLQLKFKKKKLQYQGSLSHDAVKNEKKIFSKNSASGNQTNRKFISQLGKQIYLNPILKFLNMDIPYMGFAKTSSKIHFRSSCRISELYKEKKNRMGIGSRIIDERILYPKHKLKHDFLHRKHRWIVLQWYYTTSLNTIDMVQQHSYQIQCNQQTKEWLEIKRGF